VILAAMVLVVVAAIITLSQGTTLLLKTKASKSVAKSKSCKQEMTVSAVSTRAVLSSLLL